MPVVHSTLFPSTQGLLGSFALLRRGVTCFIVACSGLATALPVLAQQVLPQIPAQQQGESFYTARMVNNAVEVRDTRDGTALLAPVRYTLLEGFDPAITSSTRFQQQPDGVDIIISISNPTSTTLPLGRFQLGIFNMGEQIDYLWSRMNAEMRQANARTHIGQSWLYPLDLYSPVMVMRNRQQAVGISLNYPVLEYEHDVRMSIASPGNWAELGEAGRGWYVSFDFRNFGGESSHTRLNVNGTIRAGESRTYVVSIRTTTNTNEWIRTLLPYRDFFRTTYGAVRYQRGTTPVRGYGVADTSFLSESNPLGYSPTQRPDLRGFGPVVRDIRNEGWDETMIWSPTGLYRNNVQLNYPYHFASTLDDSPGLSTAFSSTDGFRWLAEQGTRVGFWWGRSVQYIDGWDSAVGVPFDPDNPVHVASAFDEMDTAVRAGVTVVGLDTFTPEFIPMWRLLPWLEQLEARYPNVKFVTEPSQSDILHTRAATWYDGWLDAGTTRNRDDVFHIKGPNVLSDFLNPGAESWVGVAYYPAYHRNFGPPTNLQVVDDARRVADWGFRPIVFWDIRQPVGIESAASWEFTLPADIRDSDPQIANIRAGRLPGVGAPPVLVPAVPTNPTPTNPTPTTPTTPTNPTNPTTPTNPTVPNSPPVTPTGAGNGNPIIVVVPPTTPGTNPTAPTNPTPPTNPNPPVPNNTSNQYSGGSQPPANNQGNNQANNQVSPPAGNVTSPAGPAAPNQPQAAGNRPASRMSFGPMRRRSTAPVVVPTTRSAPPRPAPLNAPVTPQSLTPPSLTQPSQNPPVAQPRVSVPTTSAKQASGAMRRQAAPTTRQTGTATRRAVAPVRRTPTSPAQSLPSQQQQAPQTVTNTPATPPAQQSNP